MNADTMGANGSVSLLPPTKRSGAISLTPLIDVVFILLMFFMLTTSFVRERQMQLSAPVAGTAPTTTPPQQLWLDALGNLRLESPTAPKLTDATLAAGVDPLRPVVMNPAADVDVQGIVRALARLKNLGVDQLLLGRPFGASQ
jgi:biopolymer transport protein ExbD